MNTIQLNRTVSADQPLADVVEEIAARLQAGDAVDIDQYKRRYPEYAARLQDWMTVIAAMADLGHSLSPAQENQAALPQLSAPKSTSEVVATGVQTGLLGDFRILREIGRGGMGVVYEAEQISLGRRVALKVLPFAAMLDKQQLARFKNEARAAATLDHPNIVAIYSVGVERSVHFYAMQLIEGRSLAEIIAAMKPGRPPSVEDATLSHPLPPGEGRGEGGFSQTPATADTAKAALPTVHDRGSAAFSIIPPFGSRDYFRAVAQLGIQAAEALDHAHQNGILHRDIKPANLLVESGDCPNFCGVRAAKMGLSPSPARDDYTLKLWIADFGLARIEQDAGMTMTGDLLGTLRYMSPEQALAKRAIVDHRSDVYSLGVTLYELLTLQPAYTGEDRQELLRQIAFDEPKKPRQVNPRIPQDLETIILKAIRKSPEQRYATACDLANDLRRFLNGMAIEAKRPTWRERIVTWSRLHPGPMLIGAAALLVLSAVMAASMVWVKRAESRATAALRATSDLLYTTDMTLAYQAFEKRWPDETRAILDRHRPAAGEPDRRGFEWHLLHGLAKLPTSFSLAGHRGRVNELAIFPDGRRLASVGDDGTLRIWDVAARRPLKTFTVCHEPLSSVAISPDGERVAVGSTAAYLVDPASGDESREIYQGEHTIESLVFTPDGEGLLAGARYDQVCLLSLDGKVLRRIACTSRAESLEFVPDSSILLVTSRRPMGKGDNIGFVELWNAGLTEKQAELDITREDYGGRITVARTSPCGRFVAVGERYRCRAVVVDRSTGRIALSMPIARDRLNDLAYSPDGKSLALAYQNGRFECFRLKSDDDGLSRVDGSPVVSDAHRGEATCVRFVDAGTLATSGADGLIRIWDVTAKGARSLNFTNDRVAGLQLSPDGSRLACACVGELVVIETRTGDVAWRFSRADARFSNPAWSPDGELVAVRNDALQLATIHDRTGRTICTIDGAQPNAIAFSRDGSMVGIVGYEKLSFFRADDGREVGSGLPLREGLSLAFSHDGTRVAVGQRFGGIKVICVGNTQVARELPCGSAVNRLAFSPDDTVIASGHGDSIVRLWDAGTGRLKSEMIGHEQSINGLAFSPDGSTLLSASADGMIRAWMVEHGRGYGVVCHGKDLTSPLVNCELSLSEDGRVLAVAVRPPRDDVPDVLLWEIEPGVGDQVSER